MALSARFHQLDIELDAFLAAEIGEEESGVPLSVLSGLTRLGIDPWVEGGRLSDLPRENAARELMPMIAMFPKPPRSDSDIKALAQRLASLLPERRVGLVPTRKMSTAIGDRLLIAVAGRQRIRARLPNLSFFCIGVLVVLCAMAALGVLPGQ
jgi:hypothetical protein